MPRILNFFLQSSITGCVLFQPSGIAGYLTVFHAMMFGTVVLNWHLGISVFLPSIESKQFIFCIFKVWWFSSQIYVRVCSVCFSWMLCSPPRHFVAMTNKYFFFYLVHSPISLVYFFFHGSQQGFKSENVGKCVTIWWKKFLS